MPRDDLRVAGNAFIRRLVAMQLKPAVLCGLVTLAALLPRLAVFPWAENLYGDAVARTQLARAWLEAPHWIGSFADGAHQFGPLHLYLLGGALRLWNSPEHAGRLLSLILGVASTLPLFSLTRRGFGTRAAVWTCLAWAVWGLHIQMSTTAGSEALGVFLVLTAAALYAAAHASRKGEGWGAFGGAALAMNLACATRYDAWMLVPIFCIGFLAGAEDRRRGFIQAVAFGLLCAPFPVVWLWGNARAMGDPLAAIRFIDAFHQGWAQDNVHRWGAWQARALGLFFWPGAALLTLTPFVGLFGIVGLWRGWSARPELRWLFWLVILPTLYFAVRAALLTFVPLARFTAVQLALLLPWVPIGFDALLAGRSASFRRRGLCITALVALGMPVWIGVHTFRVEGPSALRPVSPLSTNSPAVMEVARAVGARFAREPGVVLLDQDPSYRDLQVAFFSHLPWDRFIRRRCPDQRLRRERELPDFVLLLPGGLLTRDPDVRLVSRDLEVSGHRYAREGELPEGYVLLRRIRRERESYSGHRSG